MYQEAADRAMVGISPVNIPENPCRFRENTMIMYMITINITAPNTVMSTQAELKQLMSC